jgi:hypothetical protein
MRGLIIAVVVIVVIAVVSSTFFPDVGARNRTRGLGGRRDGHTVLS